MLNSVTAQDIIHRYTISISNDLSTLYVKAYFGDIDFHYIYAGSKSAADYTQNMRLAKRGRSSSYSPSDHEVWLRRNAANAELSYQVDINDALGSSRWSAARKVGSDIIFSPDHWIWRPYQLEENEYIEVEFDFPTGINFTVPWQPIAKNRYRIDHTPYDWPSAAAFGSFGTDTVYVKGSKLSIAFLGDGYKTSKKELKRWIRETALSISNIYGTFPRAHAQVILIPSGSRSEPVPFGLVVRGGGYSVQFYINPNRPIEEFIADWTATHELSHSLLPYINREEAWLSEGLATYYQYVLMGRDGRLSEQQMWQRIYNGFQKGIRGSKGKTLKITAENMREYGAFRNVYWSGAAMLLRADVALRVESNGRKSLDWVLHKVKDHYLPETRTSGGREMFFKMDELAKTSVFKEVYDECILSRDFPVNEEYLKKLGIIINNGEVVLTDNAPWADIRKQIAD